MRNKTTTRLGMHRLGQRMGPLLLVGLLSLASGLAYGQYLPPLTTGLTPLETPQPAPATRFNNLDGDPIDLGQYRGRLVLVNFWATWCPPCVREMPALERLYQALQPHGVEILAINIGEDEDTVFAFMGNLEPSPSFPILLDLNADSMAAWQVLGLPTTFVVDPQGQVVYRAVGGREFDAPEMIEALRRLAAESRPRR